MLTHLDIENKKFSKQMMSGYSVDEVDEFLDEITADYEKLYKDSTDQESKNNKAEIKRLMGTSEKIYFQRTNTYLLPEEISAKILSSLKIDALRKDNTCNLSSAVITIPAIHFNSRTENDNSGVGRRLGNTYALIPFAFKHNAASSANSFDMIRESYAIATPFS